MSCKEIAGRSSDLVDLLDDVSDISFDIQILLSVINNRVHLCAANDEQLSSDELFEFVYKQLRSCYDRLVLIVDEH